MKPQISQISQIKKEASKKICVNLCNLWLNSVLFFSVLCGYVLTIRVQILGGYYAS